MREGVAAAQAVFAAFLDEMGWQAGDVQKTFCHQVGRAHQRLLFESLGLEPRIDFSTFEYLGNTGSVALPMTAAMGIENRPLAQGRPRGPVGHRLGHQRDHARRGVAAAVVPSPERRGAIFRETASARRGERMVLVFVLIFPRRT